MNMREKMAKAYSDAEENCGPFSWDTQPRFWREYGAKRMDVVLDALMEPTEEMIAAAIPALTEPDTYDLDAFSGEIPNAARLVWCAMLRAAKEGK